MEVVVGIVPFAGKALAKEEHMKTKATTANAYKLMHDGALALARAERQGIRVDIGYCERKKKHLTRKMDRHRKELRKTKLYKLWERIYGAKTNIESNHQLARLLYKVMKIEPRKLTPTGEGSTDEDALRQIDVPGLQLILSVRKLNKIRDTYLEAFTRDQHGGYLHPSFDLHNVRTYRSSSSNPNFQNIPKRDKESMQICRRALLPRPGHMLLEADFAALEVMISACYHKDPIMLKYLKDKDADMHADMAKQIFLLDELDRAQPVHSRLRTAAKNGFVFPQFYGDYYANNAASLAEWAELNHGGWSNGKKGIVLPDGQTISAHLSSRGIKSFQKFEDHIKQAEDDFWNRRFKVYNEWRNRWVEKYRKRGELQMLTGFVCSGVLRRNEIINYPIQGTAFHCLLFTFIELDRIMMLEQWESKLIGQIHDSILMDVAPNELEHINKTLKKIVKEKLPAAWDWIIVPLEIDVDSYGVDGPWIAV